MSSDLFVTRVDRRWLALLAWTLGVSLGCSHTTTAPDAAGPRDASAPDAADGPDGAAADGGSTPPALRIDPSAPETRAHVATLLGTEDFRITRLYQTSFESVDDFFGSYVERSGHLGSTYHELSAQQVHSGRLAHHAWITMANPVRPAENTNHRGYPTFQFQRTAEGPFVERVLVELWVWLDLQASRGRDRDWFSFITLTSYADDSWPRVLLLNLDAGGHVHLMHVPGQTQAVRDIFQTDTLQFPQRRWVRLSLLVDYTAQNAYGSPYAKAWQDGQLVSAARFSPRIDPRTVDPTLWPPCLSAWDRVSLEDAEARCNLVYRGGLVQAHFGMYAPPLLSSGTVFNDDLAIYELRR